MIISISCESVLFYIVNTFLSKPVRSLFRSSQPVAIVDLRIHIPLHAAASWCPGDPFSALSRPAQQRLVQAGDVPLWEDAAIQLQLKGC